MFRGKTLCSEHGPWVVRISPPGETDKNTLSSCVSQKTGMRGWGMQSKELETLKKASRMQPASMELGAMAQR